MTLHATILNRDFSTHPIRPVNFRVDKLSWTAYGGPAEATLSAGAPIERLLEYTGLIRCPITISDEFSIPAWWGFIDRITVRFEKSQFEISLDKLFNWVSVKYSFISPDNKLSDQYQTTFASNSLSGAEYGWRELTLYRKNIDDVFANNLRDTFLELSAFPQSVLSPHGKLSDPYIQIHCSGWFSTLDWVYYQNLEGFYANQGPGPGSVASGNGTISNVAQSFIPNENVDVKYVYFLMRKVGSPTNSIFARIYSNVSDAPSAVLATSTGFSGPLLSPYNYTWVKFTFSTAYTLTAGTKYWVLFHPNTSSATDYFQLRIDENSNFPQIGKYGRQYSGGAWNLLTSVTNPGSRPDLYFRVVCEKDTGAQLYDIATVGNQFFTNVGTITSGVKTSPYRDNSQTCLDEIHALMKLGMSNQRLILANVTLQRRLDWYMQPDPAVPTVYMDRHGRFFSKEQKFLQPYFPPIGQFAMLSGIDRLVMPFDRHRIPTYFVDQFVYTP
ncbi:MAG: hypothetical protein K0B06_04600 [Brevefilum sp.]|nr:hypothetical protein [Brevefilum sp.]